MTATQIGAALALCACTATALADVSDTVELRRLYIPSSPTGIALPREDWVIQREQRRPGDTAAYYMLSSDKRKVNFSVYIDRTSVCQSADNCLDASLKNPSFKDAKDLKRSTEGSLRVATFVLDKPNGLNIVQANVLASNLVDGVWYDIHLSTAAKEQPDANLLLEVLRLLKFN